MKNAVTLLTGLVACWIPVLTSAQAIDLGRGDIPVTVPTGYNETVPTPLIVLLHGYTSSGARVDDYMGLSAIADDYGFLLVAPDGRLSASRTFIAISD